MVSEAVSGPLYGFWWEVWYFTLPRPTQSCLRVYLFLCPGMSKQTAVGLCIFQPIVVCTMLSVCVRHQCVALISVQGKQRNTSLLTVVLWAYALSLLVLHGTLLVEITIVTISIVQMKTLRLRDSSAASQLTNGKARLGTQVLQCQAPTWQSPL